MKKICSQNINTWSHIYVTLHTGDLSPQFRKSANTNLVSSTRIQQTIKTITLSLVGIFGRQNLPIALMLLLQIKDLS